MRGMWQWSCAGVLNLLDKGTPAVRPVRKARHVFQNVDRLPR